ncbi:MAG: hypothetical protein AAFR67_12975, partial [Chloroflexota bacterium]
TQSVQNAPSVAQATSTTVVVDAANPNWGSFVETGTGSVDFVSGPATQPLGTGSVQFLLDDGSSGAIIGTQQFAGVRLDALTTLSYSTYNSVGNNTVAPALQFNIDYDLTDSTTSWQGRLVFEPYYDNPIVDGQWQTWDALNGRWWSTGNPVVGDAGVTRECPISSPCDIATLLGFYPDMGIQTGDLSALLFKAGSGWLAGYEGSVDAFTIGIGNENTIFDFEPTPVACDELDPIAHLNNDGTFIEYQEREINGETVTVAIGHVFNDSGCTYEVGMASYERFTNGNSNLQTQELFDSAPIDPDTVSDTAPTDGGVEVAPGETVMLEVIVPNCASQVDLFFDADHLAAYDNISAEDVEDVPLILPYFRSNLWGDYGKRYNSGGANGNRLLVAAGVNSSAWCNLTETGECPVEQTIVAGVSSVVMSPSPKMSWSKPATI